MNWQRVPNRNRIRNIRKKIRVSSGQMVEPIWDGWRNACCTGETV